MKNKFCVLYVDKEARLNISKYPNIKKHLDKFKKVITSDFWPYWLHRARDQRFFEWEKIMSLRKTSIPYMTYTDFPCYVSQTYFIIKPENINMKYLTWLLNSKVIYFWLYHKWKKQWEQLQIDKWPLLEIPIIYDESKKDKLIELVDQMFLAQKKLKEVEFEDDKKVIEKQIEIIDGKINDLVFELYGLNEEERNVVLGN